MEAYVLTAHVRFNCPVCSTRAGGRRYGDTITVFPHLRSPRYCSRLSGSNARCLFVGKTFETNYLDAELLDLDEVVEVSTGCTVEGCLGSRARVEKRQLGTPFAQFHVCRLRVKSALFQTLEFKPEPYK
jgi:hypothetical protein